MGVPMTTAGSGPWIRSARWDLTWLVGSALTVGIAPVLHALGVSAEGVAMVIMLIVGGPHVFVTFTRTNLDPEFSRKRPVYTWLVLIVPVITAVVALNYTRLFLTVFFTWASLHVLHQMIYIANGYSNRQQRPPARWEQWVEYGVVLTALYPLATKRMVEGTFTLDGVHPLMPAALLHPWLWISMYVVFGVFLLAWIGLSIRRGRRGALHYGKTALIGATVLGTHFAALYPNLDVAFQGINTWHCTQYMALIWLANRAAQERGKEQGRFVRWLSRPGSRGFRAFYGISVLATLGLVGLITLATSLFGVSWLLAYYMFGKGLLLSHYYFDSFLFTRGDEITLPQRAWSRIGGAFQLVGRDRPAREAVGAGDPGHPALG
ncbi:MAG: hypothetical protein QNJ98_17070 [Planctomycetota bacterium]|nr:hypothetical protein [Planctomycetota bacterium]